jgi:hypothetical protein
VDGNFELSLRLGQWKEPLGISVRVLQGMETPSAKALR